MRKEIFTYGFDEYFNEKLRREHGDKAFIYNLNDHFEGLLEGGASKIYVNVNYNEARENIALIKDKDAAGEIPGKPQIEYVLYINGDRRIFRDYFDETGLYVVAGRSGMGRTSLVKQILKEQAVDLCQDMNLYISTKSISEEECDSFSDKENIRALCMANMSSFDMIMCLDPGRHKPGIAAIVVDDFDELIKTENFRSLHMKNSDIMAYLLVRFKSIAEIYNISVIVVMDIKDKVDFRENKRPKLSDIKHSKYVKEFADKVLVLYRDDFYNKFSEEKDLMNVYMYDMNRKQKEILPLACVGEEYRRCERFNRG